MDRVRNLVGCKEVNKYTGKDVGIAVMDTGIFPHDDIKERITHFYDVINNRETSPYDDNGHGTHISGIIGGDGSCSHGRYCGIASKCRLIGVKILDAKGNGSIRNLVKGTEWIKKNHKKYNISIVNISVGMFPKTGVEEKNRLIESVESLWDEGLVVVTAAGNNGPGQGTITYPGISRKVITVGTIREKRTQRHFSGQGPTPFCIMKPEIIAPGFQISACNNSSKEYVIKSGTSMATPVVSGAIALLLEKYPNLEPVRVKMKIRQAAKDLGLAKNQQGWGFLWIPDLLK